MLFAAATLGLVLSAGVFWRRRQSSDRSIDGLAALLTTELGPEQG